MRIPSINLSAPAESCPWVAAMKATAQSPEYHAEGDVWTHTLMVLDEAKRIAWQIGLCPIDEQLLLWGALLHDCGKPETTFYEDGRWRSPGHSRVGAEKARRLFWELGADTEAQRAIHAMVRFHSFPCYFMPRGNAADIAFASQFADLSLLSLLAKSDMRGRICCSSDEPDMVASVELFVDAATELSCGKAPYRFSNDFSRFVFCREFSKDAYLPYERHDPSTHTLFITCGLPGSGKSTWSAMQGLPVVSIDSWCKALGVKPGTDAFGTALNSAYDEVKRILAAKTSMVFDATTLRADFRRKLVDYALIYGAKAEIAVFNPPVDACLRGNSERSASVQRRVFEKMVKNFEFPSLAEAWAVCVIRDT